MKTITLTDDQFNTLFFRIDRTVKLIIDASVEYQNSDLLNEYEIYLMFILFWKKQITEPSKLYLLVTDYYYAKHTY